ncbi:ATP-binding cassette domain-containing protein, partial [Nocardia sp. NPDC060220]|uniref:ATP-binding cassette domain-containing protein n=1 Tax=Nocardia sp. NPDC060220 TaxID=3347076 RepID=UPI0036588CEB
MTYTPTSSLAVEADGLVKVFGKQRAVDGVSLTVPRGAVYGVLGPNGAGKTTTIKMLATLLRPDGGSARIFGRDVVAEPNAVRSLIGVTGQYASVDEELTATENLIIRPRDGQRRGRAAPRRRRRGRPPDAGRARQGRRGRLRDVEPREDA